MNPQKGKVQKRKKANGDAVGLKFKEQMTTGTLEGLKSPGDQVCLYQGESVPCLKLQFISGSYLFSFCF